MKRLLLTGLALAAVSLAACEGPTKSDGSEGYGPDPKMPAAKTSPLPTVNARQAVGWAAGAAPVPAEGLKVARFAEGLEHPRWLYALPNGDILVSESNSPPREGKGIQAMVARNMMQKAGAGVPSPNRITLLRDADGDGVAELKTPFITGLNSPSGMALVGNQLFVANTDSVVVFDYVEGVTKIEGKGLKIADLPATGSNGHWARNIVAKPDGSKLYVSVGSSSNIADEGLDVEHERAAILEMNLDGSSRRIFASGLRNANGMEFYPGYRYPGNGALWVAVNERDMIGHDTPPDYLTVVQEGGFYGWPWSYWGRNVDERVKPANPVMVATALKPTYGLGAHTAALGIHFYRGQLLPVPFRDGVYIAQHGSWNRDPPSGYRVIFVRNTDDTTYAVAPPNGVSFQPGGAPVVILDGFLNAKKEAQGRPVAIVEDKAGALLVSDDVGNIVWRVTAK
ncbi:MAG: sorbosone dehydrogenase [Caulobacter sp.]|jgi:glucose/arabinose dehydrogenase|nr:sorbosone dehydrogenase [Caulobacter sp.]